MKISSEESIIYKINKKISNGILIEVCRMKHKYCPNQDYMALI